MMDEINTEDFGVSRAMQATGSVTTNDPQFSHIYEFLTNPLKTVFEPRENNGNNNQSNCEQNCSSFVDEQSQTVNPIYFASNPSQLQRATVDKYKQTNGSEPIDIRSHPRGKFRPRTEKESQDSSHYIRTEDDVQPNYPSITIDPIRDQNTLIEVSLMTINNQPHPYTLENKERQKSSLIFKEKEVNTLYYFVTEQDCRQRLKIFLMEYIKPKQEGDITKDLIRTMQLDQSRLRFTRFNQLSDGTYQRDDSSTVYSSIMIEDYGDFAVEDLFPLYGPMGTAQKLCIELKGILPKTLLNDLHILLMNDENKCIHRISTFKKRGNSLTFQMPTYPSSHLNRAKITLRIQNKENIIYEADYLYTRSIDVELNETDVSMDDLFMTDNRPIKRSRQ